MAVVIGRLPRSRRSAESAASLDCWSRARDARRKSCRATRTTRLPRSDDRAAPVDVDCLAAGGRRGYIGDAKHFLLLGRASNAALSFRCGFRGNEAAARTSSPATNNRQCGRRRRRLGLGLCGAPACARPAWQQDRRRSRGSRQQTKTEFLSVWLIFRTVPTAHPNCAWYRRRPRSPLPLRHVVPNDYVCALCCLK
jgi:hypothetical protein